MSASTTSKEIAGGFVLAVATMCVGLYFSMQVGTHASTVIIRGAYLLAVLIVMKFTFTWGKARGFSVRRGDGSIAVGHVIRNLVMTGVVCVILLLVSGPFMMLTFKLAR